MAKKENLRDKINELGSIADALGTVRTKYLDDETLKALNLLWRDVDRVFLQQAHRIAENRDGKDEVDELGRLGEGSDRDE